MPKRSFLLLLLVLLGLASLASAQTSPHRPWPELYKEWKNAREAHNAITNDEVNIEARIRANELKLEELRAAEEALRPDDPKRAAAHKALHEKVIELGIGEDKVALAKLMKKETEARVVAIQSGTAALRAIDEFLSVPRVSTDERRPQILEARRVALELGTELDSFEQQVGAFPVPGKLPVPPRDTTPTRLASLIALYRDDAMNAEQVAAIFSGQATRKVAERDRLVKFKDEAATVDVLNERLKVVNARLNSFDACRAAWSGRAAEDRKQILELEQMKAEAEERLSRGKGG